MSQTDRAVPQWRAAFRRIGRLRALQAVALAVLGLVVIAMVVVFTREVTSAQSAHEQAEEVRSAVVDLRYRLRSEHVAYWKRRATGAEAVPPGVMAALEAGRARLAGLAGRTREGGGPEAIAAADRSQRLLGELRRRIVRMQALPADTPAGLAESARAERTIAALSAAVDDWFSAESRRAEGAAQRQGALAGRLSLVVLTATGIIIAIALLAWYVIERATRRAIRHVAGAAEDLEGLSVTDALTGLANRRAFDQAIGVEGGRAGRDGRPLSVVVLDIDRFKAVNDRLGHRGGDAVLAEVARRLAGVSRGHETIARIGGEEFAWILPDSDARRAMIAAERGRAAVAASPIEGLPITISAGAAELRGPGDRVLERADAALFSAKEAGRDRAVLAAAPGVA